MIVRIKTAILFLIHLLLFQSVFGQSTLNVTDNLKYKFSEYIKSVPREEIYIHTDRDEYISGENLWFSVYLIDRQSFKPSSESSIAYFELLNQENRPIVQKKILLDRGFGPGQIVLPDTISSGTYTLRAYTNWMKNFLPYNCFMKDIKIYNAFSNRTIKENLYAVRAAGKTGEAQNSPGDKNSGLSLEVNNTKPDFLEITLTADAAYRTVNGNLSYLFIQTHGIVNHVNTETITDEITKILIPKKQLTSGINQITVFNSDGKPVGEKLIFTPDKENPIVRLHSSDSSLLRKKISIDLDFGQKLTKEIDPGTFSISVAPVTNNHSILDINDYLVFGSEFGPLPVFALKGKNINRVNPSLIDSLLQYVRSNWIDWDLILSDELPDLKYQIEKDNIFLSGKLVTGDQKYGDPEKYVLLSPPGKIAGFQYDLTDKNGNFSFNIHIDDKVNDLIIQPDVVAKNQSMSIQSPYSDLYLRPDIDSAGLLTPYYISTWSVNHQVTKIYGISSSGDPLSRIFSVPKPRRFYGKPDIELVLKDYIALPVMQEVFFELIPGVSLKSKKSVYEMTMNDPVNNLTYDVTPGMFIDGVKINDPSIIAGLDPEFVEKIDVVRSKYFVGDYKFYGIVNILTKAGDFSHVSLPDYAIRLPYKVIDPVSTFVSPDYSSVAMKTNHVPDFRNTLYWNPLVKQNPEGKAEVGFWTSDFVSVYEINIQGITSEGKPFSLRKLFKVKQ